MPQDAAVMLSETVAPVRNFSGAPRHALNVTAIVCAGAAVVALVVTSVIGQPLAGVALGLGLILGAANGFLAERLLGFGVAFAATSLLRLMILTALAVLSGLVLGWERMILVAVGMAVAQLVLAGASLREVIRSR